MIPIRLSLENFLSYGTAAPTLDFEQFQVACLSGRNGQGKSALLDAITWAVWGKARKSSGNRKPDEELLRVGTREMQVEYVFDVEGERYRVTRSYQESATGKTHTSGLELHMKEEEAGSFRPLTASSMRETQQAIEAVVGLDYDTFINSAFLLQGRSDEFTQKRPSERKEILARILNLGRYEALQEKARTRERAARTDLKQAEREMARLEKTLEKEDGWQEELAAVKEQIAAHKKQLASVRRQERELTERLAGLKARDREGESLQKRLKALQLRSGEREKEAGKLRDRIEKSEELISKAEAIERDHRRLEELQEEREVLDVLQEKHRRLEKKIERKRAALADQKSDLEKRLHGLDVRLESNEKALRESKERLAKEGEARRRLREARAAEEQVEKLRKAQSQLREIDEEKKQLKEQILTRREEINGRQQALKEQIQETQASQPNETALKEEEKKLQDKRERLQKLKRQLEETRSSGQSVAETLRERKGQLSTRRTEREQKVVQLGTIQSTEDGACPTCGTKMTPRHRRQAEGHFQEEVEQLDSTISGLEEEIEDLSAKRAALREQYQSLQQQIADAEGTSERLAEVREQLRSAEEIQKVLARKKKERSALRKRLEKKAFARPERKRWQSLQERCSKLAFDEEAFQKVQETAVCREQYEKELEKLEDEKARKKELEEALCERKEQRQQLKQQLEKGIPFDGLSAEIQQVETELDDLSFDAERLKEVRRKIKALSGAGDQMKDLDHARTNRADWKEQLQSIEQKQEEGAEERAQLEEKVRAVEEALKEKPDLVRRQEAAADERKKLEERMQECQSKRGRLAARLEQAEQDRSQLDQKREEHAESQEARLLYGHLKEAFGKHGIPSLIIEETLPEIEERANGLLERLTDGKMHVRLETLKDKKSGGTRETLEIIITDEQGVPRPYETFSGGESFRVNFALRIALAQLLAERSGVRVRTLVIDEGFGTQDAEGVQNLVEAIQATQDDFDKIIVITHLERLKEAFPVRIEVEKDPVEGSSFEVIGV